MDYIDNYLKLREIFLSGESEKTFDKYSLHKFNFHSQSYMLLPGGETYDCKKHKLEFDKHFTFFTDVGKIQGDVHINDFSVEENRNFNFYLLKSKDTKPIKKITFLLHGFNEKNWDKYFPWGKAICDRTGSAVVFFPIAFHMQRAPMQWSKKKEMYELSEERKKKFPNIINSTLSNVAISMRLHTSPQRFIWSGLQTYFDIIQFIEECKEGKYDLIDKDFSIDIFAYSIGGLLALILKLSDYKNYFTETKTCLFCSGAVFNRLSPVSKFIMDSEASVALYSYLIEHFDSFLKKDLFLHHFITEDHLEGKVFHAILEYKNMRDFRESLLKKSENKIYTVALKNDSVIPPFEIINTLQGAFRNINIAVDELDFKYNYRHENPFPIDNANRQIIDEEFNRVFDRFGCFLNS